MERQKVRIEGYWWSQWDPHLPMPEQQPDPIDQEFLDKLAKVELGAVELQYRGTSICRICRQMNGSREFEYQDWRWPKGLRHYFEEHNVHPTPEFAAFIRSVEL